MSSLPRHPLVFIIILALLAEQRVTVSATRELREQDGLLEGHVELDFLAMQPLGTSTANVTGFRPANVTAKYTIVSNMSALNPALPILYLLPMWNVEPEEHSYFIGALANKGYAVVASQSVQTFPFPVEGMPYPGCPTEQLVPSAAPLSYFSLNMDLFEEYLGAKAGDNPEVVLLGAGTGAWAAMLAATGQCDNIRLLRDPEAIVYCNGYRGFKGAIKGVVPYEISVNGIETSFAGFNVSDDMFTVWTAGQWDYKNSSFIAFELSSGGGCSSYVQFDRMNLYGWVDYVANSTRGQCPPCAPYDKTTPEFFPTQEEQESGIDLSASLIDAIVRAALLKDEAAAQSVADIGQNPRMGRTLDTDCYVAP